MEWKGHFCLGWRICVPFLLLNTARPYHPGPVLLSRYYSHHDLSGYDDEYPSKMESAGTGRRYVSLLEFFRHRCAPALMSVAKGREIFAGVVV